jgi:hypothetical protein
VHLLGECVLCLALLAVCVLLLRGYAGTHVLLEFTFPDLQCTRRFRLVSLGCMGSLFTETNAFLGIAARIYRLVGWGLRCTAAGWLPVTVPVVGSRSSPLYCIFLLGAETEGRVDALLDCKL